MDNSGCLWAVLTLLIWLRASYDIFEGEDFQQHKWVEDVEVTIQIYANYIKDQFTGYASVQGSEPLAGLLFSEDLIHIGHFSRNKPHGAGVQAGFT